MSSLPDDPTASAEATPIHLPTAEDAADIAPGLVTLRRALHENVEVGLDLPVTQKLVLEAIEGLDVEVSTGQGLSSIVVVLRGGARKADSTGVVRGCARMEDSSGVVPAVLLRGDMAGLRVTEATGFDFVATSGKMHACGHDLHTAGLVGALGLLHRVRENLPGDVVFMFQPAEE